TIWAPFQKALIHSLPSGLSRLSTQLMLDRIRPPRLSMLLRLTTDRRNFDTASALACALTAAGENVGGFLIGFPGKAPACVTGSLNLKSNVCTLSVESTSRLTLPVLSS